MSILVAGLASGALMAHTFIVIGCLTAFFLIKNPSPRVETFMTRYPPGTLVFGMIAVAFPAWGVVGVVLSIAFLALDSGLPGGGLGSANIVYTLFVAAAFAALFLPFAILLRRVWPGVACLALASSSIYGWLLPFLAT